MTVILNPIGGSSGAVTGSSVYSQNIVGYINNNTVSQANINQTNVVLSKIAFIVNANQIGGLVKMIPCDYSDCRIVPQRWCYRLPVFGANSLNQSAGYSNDFNTFLINFNDIGTPKFTIQKQKQSFFDAKSEVSGAWIDIADIIDNTYGIYNPIGSISSHSTYMMFQVNWGNVYTLNGNGIYRIIFQSCTNTFSTGSGQVQSSSQSTISPYRTAQSLGFFGGAYKTASVDISINWNGKNYILPTFILNKVSSAADITSILAAINGATSPTFPFTAIADPTDPTENFIIKGTGYAAQNGALSTAKYQYYDTSGNYIVHSVNYQKALFSGGSNGTVTIIPICHCGLQSPPFELWGWDCFKAHGTTKFETWNIGTLGDINNPGALFDLCGLSLYDSIRVKGFFGYNEYTYDEIILEYGQQANVLFGTMERVRDKTIPGYKWNSNLLPTWVHKQLATVMMMADTVLVSDYNINNPDYFLNRKNVIKKGAYKPKYKEKSKKSDLVSQEFFRRDPVSVEFVEGIQSVIKSTCCINS